LGRSAACATGNSTTYPARDDPTAPGLTLGNDKGGDAFGMREAQQPGREFRTRAGVSCTRTRSRREGASRWHLRAPPSHDQQPDHRDRLPSSLGGRAGRARREQCACTRPS
jgi:hypothetical protein